MAAHPQRGGATVGQRDDGFGTEVVGGEQRTHGDGLVDAVEGFAGEISVELHVTCALGGVADFGHFDDSLQREFAGGRFGGEHHRVGTVQHGVGDVTHLGAGGHGVGDHALHHLGGGDDELVVLARQFDHALLQRWHDGVTHFNRQIAPRHHDAVAGQQNLQQLGDGLSALDFCDQTRLVVVLRSGHVAQLARHLHIGRILGEAHRHVISLEAHRGADVVHVFGRQRRRGQAAAFFIDAFVIRQLTALAHRGVHGFTFDGLDDQHDQAVVQQQHVTSFDLARQGFVIEAHSIDIAELGAGSIQNEFLPLRKHDFVVCKLANADFGALQIGHDPDLTPRALSGFAHEARAVDVILRLAVAEVQPHHVHARADHLLQHGRIAGCGAQCGDDFGGTPRLCVQWGRTGMGWGHRAISLNLAPDSGTEAVTGLHQDCYLLDSKIGIKSES